MDGGRRRDSSGRDEGHTGGRGRDFGPLPKLYQIFLGEVTRIEGYGAFIRIPGCKRQGLVHRSQISNTKVEKPEDVLVQGESVYCKVITIDPEGSKIGLSMKVVNQTSGEDKDPQHVQSSLDEQRRKTQHVKEIKGIQLGAVFDTTCKKCGGKGHLAQDCFQQPGGASYDLLPDVDHMMQQAKDEVVKEGKASKKKKKEKKHKKKKKKQKQDSDSSSDEEKEKKKKKKKKQKPESDSSSESDREHSRTKKLKKKNYESDSSSDDDTEYKRRKRRDSGVQEDQRDKRRPSQGDRHRSREDSPQSDRHKHYKDQSPNKHGHGAKSETQRHRDRSDDRRDERKVERNESRDRRDSLHEKDSRDSRNKQDYSSDKRDSRDKHRYEEGKSDRKRRHSSESDQRYSRKH